MTAGSVYQLDYVVTLVLVVHRVDHLMLEVLQFAARSRFVVRSGVQVQLGW